MSRNTGSKNARPTFMTKERIIKKSDKLQKDIQDFIEKALRNRPSNNLVDADKLYDAIDHLAELSKLLKMPD